MKSPNPEISEAINELAPLAPEPFRKSPVAEACIEEMRRLLGPKQPDRVPGEDDA